MTYEYVCSACNHHWEAEQSISAAPLKKCPKCAKHAAKRQISLGGGFILKGGGWYADGYGSKHGGPATEGHFSQPAKPGDPSEPASPAPPAEAATPAKSESASTKPEKPKSKAKHASA